MAKKNIITIDIEKECTVGAYAKELKIPTQTISQWILRDKIKHRTLPVELNGLVLVERGTETVNKKPPAPKKK